MKNSVVNNKIDDLNRAYKFELPNGSINSLNNNTHNDVVLNINNYSKYIIKCTCT